MKYLLYIFVFFSLYRDVKPEKDSDIYHKNVGAQFKEYIETYGKVYTSLNDFENRLKIFAKNLREIEDHNS